MTQPSPANHDEENDTVTSEQQEQQPKTDPWAPVTLSADAVAEHEQQTAREINEFDIGIDERDLDDIGVDEHDLDM